MTTRVVATDLDGTIVRSDGHISSRTRTRAIPAHARSRERTHAHTSPRARAGGPPAKVKIGFWRGGAIFPVATSIALVQPCEVSTGSNVPKPFASPAYSIPTEYLGACGARRDVTHQSIAFTYNKPVC